MSDDRRMAVLRAIVEDFISTSEPVGSKALVDRHQLGVSPATIRNDMAALEEDGLIAQPHTSAGRIPTDKGYRIFVDRLATIRPLTSAERRAIQSFLDQAIDLDDVVTRTVRLLSQFTHQVALVQYPSLTRATVRHLELVPLAPQRLLLVLITSTGRVKQRMVSIAHAVTEETVAKVRAVLAEAVDGKAFAEAQQAVPDLAGKYRDPEAALLGELAESVVELLGEDSEERVVIGGAANLARYGEDFHASVSPVLEALEENVVLLRLLSEQTSEEKITVRIGTENLVASMNEAAVVTAGYGNESGEFGRLGLVGPTRMDYGTNIAAVRAVARYLGRILAEQ